MAWTADQEKAINECGKNIIVSAGAGSGKTAVLTERVITKLKKGININELLILTFTNAAAMEMKDRIREAITKDESLHSQLDLIDGSYITTFDSFALSIVKKYLPEEVRDVYINYVNGGYYGLEALVTRYATMLASCDCSINTSLINSRLAHIFYANSTADLKTMKKIYDDISAGKPAVFLKKGVDEVYDSKNEFINVKQNFIAKEVLDVKKEILREFLTYIGINNAMEKRERSITEEMNVNIGEVMSMVSLWKDTLNKCLERINSLFGFNISIKYNDEVIREMQQSDAMEVTGDELN